MQHRLSSSFRRPAFALRQDTPLSDEQIRGVAPSIFGAEAHESRSDRYTYIPTIDVLSGLRKEGFQPFAVAQTKVRDDGKRDHTKHMIRLRHPSQINAAEANEIILLNSHDGSSSFQIMAGMFRFVCFNGMVCGDLVNDVRVRHSGDVKGAVVQGAFDVLDGFDLVKEHRDDMRALTLNTGEQQAFANAALALRYDEDRTPVTETQILRPRRVEDRSSDLWSTFNVIQENMLKGGQQGETRDVNGRRRRTKTREVTGIDQSVKLNRALWILAEQMKKLKA